MKCDLDLWDSDPFLKSILVVFFLNYRPDTIRKLRSDNKW